MQDTKSGLKSIIMRYKSFIVLVFFCFLCSCASINTDKLFFYTLELTPAFELVGKTKSYGYLKPQPPGGHFRYWVYNKENQMIYKGVFQFNHICLPEEENHVEIKDDNLFSQSIFIRVPAETQKIRILTHDLQDVTSIIIK
jgi:hypothetical protein